jgi:hypothetical protein
MYLKTMKCLGVAALIAALPALAVAAEPQGVWQGVIQQANSDVALRLTFAPQLVKLHFNEPLSCDVPAKFLKADGDTLIYRFAVSVNGGRFCDGVVNHDLRIKAAPEPKRELDIVFDGPRATWRGRLTPVASP